MKQITKTTVYWLFKPTSQEGKYYFIRSMTSGIETISWFIGYENNFGSVSGVGGELSSSVSENLEIEFQKQIQLS